MPMLVNMPDLEAQLIADRRERGIDQHDEVWDGVYVMAPIANNEHQHIQAKLTAVLVNLIDLPGFGVVQAGGNVSDRDDDWTKNYRVPDVLVFLKVNSAEDRNSHWFGGPDFAVEIVSGWDRSRDKIDFYSEVGVRELLIIDRDPWQLELFRLTDGHLRSISVATEENATEIHSEVVPISLRLNSGQKRPSIHVTSLDAANRQSWSI